MKAEPDKRAGYPGIPVSQPCCHTEQNHPFPAMPYEKNLFEPAFMAKLKETFYFKWPAGLAHIVDQVIQINKYPGNETGCCQSP